MKGTLEERFWAKVDKRGPDDCWEWQAAKNTRGYGMIRQPRTMRGYRGINFLAHRVSWVFANGPIPEGLCVLHHCDNPGCVNPAHLFLGTQADNVRDTADKGRTDRGEKRWSAKLTEQNVHNIRYFLRLGTSQKVIAEGYGVSQAIISDIKTGKGWGWLKEEEEVLL